MSTPTIAQVQSIITTAAVNAVNNGKTIGISIGAVLGSNPPVTACAGVSNYATQQPVATDTIFQIGSITKIFTTGYFGQLVYDGTFSLNQPLSDFINGALPGLPPNSALADTKLEDIATFAAGLKPSTPPPSVTGYPRPTIAEWGVANFEDWFVTLSPTMEYFYSDSCTGMIGLLSTTADPTTVPLPANAVNVWLNAIDSNIINPLQMNDTVVVGISELTKSQKSRLANGYQQAIATAVVSNGSVTDIKVNFPGARYKTAPNVSIVSATGTGATANAVLAANGMVSSIEISNGGSGYATAPTVLVAPGEPSINNTPVWAAAGAVSSTVNDMLTMIQQCLAAGTNSTPLQAGLNIAMQSYGNINNNLEYGMAWEIDTSNNNAGPVIFKPGGLAGFSSYICILPKQNLGFIVFCNTWLSYDSKKFTPANTTVQLIINQLFPQ